MSALPGLVEKMLIGLALKKNPLLRNIKGAVEFCLILSGDFGFRPKQSPSPGLGLSAPSPLHDLVRLGHWAVRRPPLAHRAGSAGGRLTRSTRTNHGKNFTDMHLDADIVGYDFPDDGARQMLSFERTSRYHRAFDRRLRPPLIPWKVLRTSRS